MTIDQLFAQANTAGAINMTLRVDRVLGNELLHLSGWRVGSDVWTRVVARDDRVPFTHEQFNHALERHGWTMPTRPVKQPGVAFHWLLQPTDQAEDAHRYSSQSMDIGTVERRRIAAGFGSFLGVDAN